MTIRERLADCLAQKQECEYAIQELESEDDDNTELIEKIESQIDYLDRYIGVLRLVVQNLEEIGE